jgi:protease I
MTVALKDKKILMLLGPSYRDEEATVPLDFLRSKGAHVDVVSTNRGKLEGLHGAEVEANMVVSEAKPDAYDAMVIPGGRSPAGLRKHPEAVDLVREFFKTGRPVAAICHGPQMLAAAGLLKGRTITGYYKIREEMLQAEANFVDKPVVIDANLITSRQPGDLEDFNAAIERALS